MVDSNWLKDIESDFGPAILGVRESAPGEPEITVSRDRAHELLTRLHSLPGGAFDHLADLTAYDEKSEALRFKVVYALISMERKKRCNVIVPITELAASSEGVRTIVDLWPGANWLERETYDMYGIHFEGHPDLRRMLMPEAFQGHPLRKDFDVFYRQNFPEAVEEESTFDPFGSTIVSGKE
mgnify:CR=1 FL=1